jgi:hypothetical protein
MAPVRTASDPLRLYKRNEGNSRTDDVCLCALEAEAEPEVASMHKFVLVLLRFSPDGTRRFTVVAVAKRELRLVGDYCGFRLLDHHLLLKP